MSALKPSFVLCMLVTASLLLASVSCTRAGESDQAQAVSALANAEAAVVSAYEAVLKAESEGANVSSLMTPLNEAGELLSKAKVAYRSADFEAAVRFGSIGIQVGESVKNDAEELAASNYKTHITRYWLTLAGSLIAVVAIGLGSFWGWRAFKRHYYKRVLELKPEVSFDES